MKMVQDTEVAEPAIRALGPLFKLTEVHIWEDVSPEARDGISTKPAKSIGNDNVGSNNGVTSIGLFPSPEELELSRKMKELGLPFSFQTNKLKRTTGGGKRKNTKKKNLFSCDDIYEEIVDSVKVNEWNASLTIFDNKRGNLLSSMSTLNQSELYSDIMESTNGLDHLYDKEWESRALSTSIVCAVNQSASGEDSNLGLINSLPCDYKFTNNLLGEEIKVEGNSNKDGETPRGSWLVNGSDDHGGEEAVQRQIDFEDTVPSPWLDHEADRLHFCADAETIHDSEVASHSESAELVDYNISFCNDVFGDWKAYWDEDYMRYYFHNSITNESTWDPPPGVDSMTQRNEAGDLSGINLEIEEVDAIFPTSGESNELGLSCDLPQNHDLTIEPQIENGTVNQTFDEANGDDFLAESYGICMTRKKKKKMRKLKSIGRLPLGREENQIEGILDEFLPIISKYWSQRYLLFSRFDDGIQMDLEGWFSVTPEPIAKHHALRCGVGTIVDCFTGVGGNAIQFAQRSKHVIAIDIDSKKIGYSWHNAAIYGVHDRIDFLVGDSIVLAPQLKGDAVFLSPPWGGPDYVKEKTFDIKKMLKPCDGYYLFNLAKKIAPKVVMFLPRNVDINQLAELALSASPPWSLEVEKNYLNGKLKAITAYLSEPTG